eukprot:s1166_g12.t1
MHWSHSILEEKNFLSPWAAIEQATDLAQEVGSDESIVIEAFSLPPRPRKQTKTVAFDPIVQVVSAKPYTEEFQSLDFAQSQNRHRLAFHPHGDCVQRGQDDTHFPMTHPRDAPAGDTGGDTGGTVPTGSGSSRPTSRERHFFDRRIPSDYPNYLHHLHHLWHERGESLAEDEYYRLRTWYVHHEHHPQCRRPRIVELEGDGSTWHQDILSAWPDKVQQHEALQIAVVFPQLRHFGPGRIVHADIILLQGNLARFGGITTVYPNTGDDQARYVWAISYPHRISGQDILEGAEVLPLPADHYCDIYHGWTNIPSTSTPTHWMVNGHSFFVIVRENTQPLSAASQPDPEPLGMQGAEEEAEEEAPPENSESDEEELQIVNQHHAEEHILALVDIVYQSSSSGLADADRAVFRLAQPIDRARLLTFLQLQDYCVWQDDRCHVLHNNMIWSVHDLRERHLEHGAYLRIEVPPVSDLDIDTRVAVRIARECELPAGASLNKRRKTSAGNDEAATPGLVARGAALLQVALARTHNLWEEAPKCRQHSASFSSLRAGHGGPRGLRPPPQKASTDWLTPLGMLFMENMATEYEFEGPVIYVNTWYLHYRRYRRLSDSRMLRLDDYQDLWYNDLCELWSDVLDPMLPVTVHLVQPSPPEADAPRHVGHLLLVQGEVEHAPHAPVLFTAFFDHPVTSRIWHLAALIPRHRSGRQLCTEMELARWCSQRLCRVRSGEAIVPLDQMTEVQDGDSVVITITTLPVLDDIEFPDDQINMMQILNFARGLESEFTIAGPSICVLRVWF